MPERPLTPPFKPIEFLPFSCTLSSSETVPLSVSGVLFGVLVDLERVEVVQLVQAKQALLPQIAVVDLAFFEQQLAADYAVAGDGVALELDARHGKRLAFVDVDVQIDQVLGIIDARRRHRGEVDVAQRTISLAQIIQTLADGRGIKPFPVLGRELGRAALLRSAHAYCR